MSRYKINKIGLLNYWLYDEEEFYFCDGKLLLRGSNGSGKSVTMVSFFPLLFDGNKNPERFDTFGSRDRKIEDYVLPMDSDLNESISYLYMEFYRKDVNKYLTIGIGLKAIRNRNVDFWAFALTDNRRVNDGFRLYKDRRIPLTKRECECEVGKGGEFVTTNKEYKEMVNRLLFGFENESMYTELINLMLQLRSPKLSKDYKPTRLVDILSGVLEPISDAEIQKMSSTIEAMNEYKERLDDLREETKVVNLLKNNFYDYSNIVLYHKCNDYLNSLDELNKNKTKLDTLKTELTNLNEEIYHEKETLTSYKLELDNLKEEELKISDSSLNSLLEQRKSLEDKLKQTNEVILKKENNLSDKENERDKKENLIKDLEDKIYLEEKSLKSTHEEIDILLEDLPFKNVTLSELSNSIEDYHNIINVLKPLIIEKENIEEKRRNNFDKIKDYEDDINTLNTKQSKLTNQLLEEANTLEDTYTKLLHNKVLLINNEVFEEISSIIHSLKLDVKLKLDELINKLYREKSDELYKAQNILRMDMKYIEKEIELEENNLNKVSDIFEENVFESDRKSYVESLGLEGKYLYELIEFKDNIDSSIRKNLENALRSLGLLHTLVIKNNKLNLKTFGNLKEVKNSLLKYFKVTDASYEKEVSMILNSISTDSGDTFITPDGEYQMGIIKGKTQNDYKCRFIGEIIQTKYLEEVKKSIQTKIDELSNNLNKIVTNLNNINEDIKLLELEKNINVDFTKYFAYIDEQKQNNFEISQIRNNIMKLHDEVKVYEKELNKVNTKLEENKNFYDGGFTLKDITTTEQMLNKINLNLKDYQNISKNIERFKETNKTYQEDLDNILLDISSLRDEHLEYQSLYNEYSRQLNNINEEINQDKYKDLKEKLETIKERIKFLEDGIILKNSNIAKLDKDNEYKVIELDNIDKVIEEESIINKCLLDIFMKEYNLGYSSYKEEMKDIKTWFKGFKLEKNKALNDASDNFNDRISEYLYKLQNYAGKKVYKFDNLEDTVNTYTEDDSLKEKLSNILINAKRTDLEFRYKNGITYNLLELSDALKTNLEETESLLREEDRRLFEDLLLNNVGDSIREKIRASKIWVNEVKNIMEEMQTSSGLSFSLSWTGKPRDNEEELDTREIVSIFEGSAESLKEEDTEKIIKHFRSKIALEEEKYEDNERNYINIIRDVLDYRKWFQFKLYFKRGKTEKRELTDKEFSKFSGGEKAIAMYIPLFAGINAKYNSASTHAPRVIALDEAFAGVDDTNIEDSFRILESLNLDYVLTSQILWGDYKTVKNLAIAELHHGQNSNAVSVLRYKWDGAKKTLVTKESEYQN